MIYKYTNDLIYGLRLELCTLRCLYMKRNALPDDNSFHLFCIGNKTFMFSLLKGLSITKNNYFEIFIFFVKC